MDEADRPEFSVYQFFPDDTYEAVARLVPGKDAVELAFRLTQTVGARNGTVRRIIITDGGDNTCFEWTAGRGVTFK